MKPQVATSLRGARLLLEEQHDHIELVRDERLVEGRERDRLRQAGAGFDEDELAACERRAGAAAEHGVGGELQEIVRIISAQLRFFGGQRAEHRLDFAQRAPDDLVDAPVEREGPAAVGQLAGDHDLEGGAPGGSAGLGMLMFGPRAEFTVPVLAQLRAPETA